MITLTIDNSYSSITGLNRDQHKELKELLSYMLNPQASYFSGNYGPKKQSLLTKKGEFPTGLLYIVERYYAQYLSRPVGPNFVKPKVIDNRRKPIALESIFKMRLGLKPYVHQIEASKAARDAINGRGIIVAPTGLGKSVIIALIINELQVPTLVVVPSLELKKQLTASLKDTFGEDKVGPKNLICVENVDALESKKSTQAYDCVIIDEFHHAAAKTYRKLNKTAWTRTYYRFGLTATPFRSQDNERLLLESVLSEVIYQVPYQTAVNSGYIVPMEAYYVEVPKQLVHGTTWAAVYSELVVNNPVRNGIIAKLCSSLKAVDASTLCLVKEIKHGAILSELCNTPFANGQDEDSGDWIKFFNQGKVKALIGTVGVLGEGVDSKPCEYVIIAGLGKSKNSIMQQIGRGFRVYPQKESCKIILIKDVSHKWSKDHFKAQCKILAEEYGITPVEIKVD